MAGLPNAAFGGLALMVGMIGALGIARANHVGSQRHPQVQNSSGPLETPPSSAFTIRLAHAAEPAGSREALSAFISRRQSDLDPTDKDQPSSAEPAHVPASPSPRLDADRVARLAERCAPTTPAAALVSISRVESGFAPLTIGVNGSKPATYKPRSLGQAVDLAQALINHGHNIDLGLAQINNRNLAGLDLSVADAFDPCRNLAAAAVILNRGYERALSSDHVDRPILQIAYSIYNTGDTERGLANGYVDKVEAARRR